MNLFFRGEDGFTGLEAAVVLVAFVVIAAVFSFVAMGAGFYTTQTAQTSIHTGVSQASSSMEIVGDVMGIAFTTRSRLTYVNISVGTTAGGSPMDLSQMVVSYSDNNGHRNPDITNNSGGIQSCVWQQDGDTNILIWDSATDADVHWCVSQKINDKNPGAENNLLEPGEIWILSVAVLPSATPDTRMTINLQPATGAVLPVTRTLPGELSKVQPLH